MNANAESAPYPFFPIGVYRSEAVYPYDAGRQPSPWHLPGVVEIEPRFAEGLAGLEHFSHIWIVFRFHHNEHFHLKVMPPRESEQKLGVFATRSPYRPNAIGMSVVRLLQVDGHRLFVAGADLLDDTPVLDIKPYLPEADSMAEANAGWLTGKGRHHVALSPRVLEALEWLEAHHVMALRPFLLHQLEYEPTDHSRKRVRLVRDNLWELSYRTWRAVFVLSRDPDVITVQDIESGYSSNELEQAEDKYADKEIHRQFRVVFGKSL